MGVILANVRMRIRELDRDAPKELGNGVWGRKEFGDVWCRRMVFWLMENMVCHIAN